METAVFWFRRPTHFLCRSRSTRVRVPFSLEESEGGFGALGAAAAAPIAFVPIHPSNGATEDRSQTKEGPNHRWPDADGRNLLWDIVEFSGVSGLHTTGEERTSILMAGRKSGPKRLRVSRLLIPSGYGGEFTQPSMDRSLAQPCTKSFVV